MSPTKTASNTTAPTQLLQVSGHSYAYRRFGEGAELPLLCLQHFTGTLDNWDPAVSDPLASRREVILFDNAGIRRYGLSRRPPPRQVRRPKNRASPNTSRIPGTPAIFFAPTSTSQAAGEAFIARLMQRTDDRDPPSGPNVAKAQITAFREWERVAGERFADLRGLRHPTVVVQGFHDEMIPVRNSYWLAENLPNAALLAYQDAGHGSLFQYPESFTGRNRRPRAQIAAEHRSAAPCSQRLSA
jgi:pimeloyl-ACP methyl ester carboxylesterase